jgi:spermidine dehydrogenase
LLRNALAGGTGTCPGIAVTAMRRLLPSAALAGCRLTRRDFINTTLVGASLLPLGGAVPASAAAAGAVWNGPGGVGDYRFSNGNRWEVMEAAHRIRDQSYQGLPAVVDTGEQYDLVIVGGGFTGLGACHAFRRHHANGKCLLLDNQAVFGGFAKSNSFDVDGYRVAGPQASLNFIMPLTANDRKTGYWDDLGLPEELEFAVPQGGDPAIKFAKSTSAPLYHGEQTASVGYFFDAAVAGKTGAWVRDIWRDDLARAAFPEPFRQGLLALRDRRRRKAPGRDEAAWLDSMTFEAFVTRELGLDPAILSFITKGMCVGGPQISAYAARSLPGLERFADGSAEAKFADRFVSFSGGNTVLARYFVKSAIPEAIAGPATLAAIAAGPIRFAALDQAGATCRMRLRATVVRVEHDGDPESADTVSIVYEKAGRLHRVRAKAVVMGIGSWVAKHVVVGLPDDRRAALDQRAGSTASAFSAASANRCLVTGRHRRSTPTNPS